MFVLYAVLVLCAFCTSDAGFVDTLPKCSVKDDECMKELYKNSIHDIAKVGVPELNIPSLDPMHLTNVTVTVLESIRLTLTEGVVKGISNCEFKKFHIDLEKQYATQEILCNPTVKGQVVFDGSGPAIQGLTGSSSIDGNGKIRVKLDKLYMNFDFPFYPVKKEDGDIYFQVANKNIHKNKYDVEKATFAADKLFIGKNDISPIVIPYLNQNFKMLMKSFGNVFIDKAMEFYLDFLQKFFGGIPAKAFIIEDLEPYLKN